MQESINIRVGATEHEVDVDPALLEQLDATDLEAVIAETRRLCEILKGMNRDYDLNTMFKTQVTKYESRSEVREQFAIYSKLVETFHIADPLTYDEFLSKWSSRFGAKKESEYFMKRVSIIVDKKWEMGSNLVLRIGNQKPRKLIRVTKQAYLIFEEGTVTASPTQYKTAS